MDILNQIIQSSCGKDETGKANSAITLECSMWPIEEDNDIDTDVTENDMLDEEMPKSRCVGIRSVHKPIVEIEKHNDLMQIDIIFNSYIDADLRYFWSLLEKYGDLLNAINDDSVEFPSLTLSIAPVAHEGAYYILCINPMFWALQPQAVGGDSNVIRLVFDAEDFGVFESNEIDMEEVKSEVDREYAEKEAMYAQMMEKETEYAKQLNDRNERIERMRSHQDEMNEDNNFDENDENNDENDNNLSNSDGNGRYKII